MAAAVAKAAVSRLTTGNAMRVETPADLMALANIFWLGGASKMPGLDRPEKVARLIIAGREIGFSDAQAVESLWMGDNGKISIYGEGALALVRASGLLESFREWVDGEGDERAGHCEAKRAGVADVMHQKFTIADAKRAGLIERAQKAKGVMPWVGNPDRQSVMRARGFVLRDLFPDVLKGLVTTEELRDYDGVQAAEVKVVAVTADAPALPPPAATPAASPEPAGATATATTPAAPAGPPQAVTEEQLRQIAAIRAGMAAGRGLREPADIQTAWVELLLSHGFGKAKASQFTFDEAAAFIAKEGPVHDPFGHPPTGTSSKT